MTPDAIGSPLASEEQISERENTNAGGPKAESRVGLPSGPKEEETNGYEAGYH
jgi:hypothetical protein